MTRGGAFHQLSGYPIEEIPSELQWWRDRVHPEDRAAVLAAFDAAISGERRELVLLYRFRKRDGTYALLLDRAFILENLSGAPRWIVGFAREVGGSQRPGDAGVKDGGLDRDRLEFLSRSLVDSVEDERRRVSRELHDEIGQLLTSLRIHVEAGTFDRRATGEILDELFARVRDISTSLRPPMLDDLGLGPALSWYCQRFTVRTGVDVKLMTAGLEQRYSAKIELAIFRVVQEALTNVARHARVRSAQVGVRGSAHHVECLVLDRGVGFADAAVHAGASGLIGMRERVLSAGGRLLVKSSPGQGTRISVWIRTRRPWTRAES